MVTEILTGMPVDDLATATAWYEIFAGRPARADAVRGEAVWQIEGMGWISVVEDAARAGSGLLTLVVDDLERHVGFLAMRGIAPESIETVPGAVRRATINDPAGNTITIAERLAAGGG